VDTGNFDHIAECSLIVSSVSLLVGGCTDGPLEAKRIDLPIGAYRVRANFANLESMSSDEADPSDSYHVQLWLAPEKEVSVLKQGVVSLD